MCAYIEQSKKFSVFLSPCTSMKLPHVATTPPPPKLSLPATTLRAAWHLETLLGRALNLATNWYELVLTQVVVSSY